MFILPMMIVAASADISKVFYINLDDSTTRRTHMEKELAIFTGGNFKPKTKVERVPAISREQVSNYESLVDQLGISENILAKEDLAEIKATVGCWLSHTTLLERLTNTLQAHEHAVILEDDVIFPEDWSYKLENVISTAPGDWDVLKVCGWGAQREKDAVDERWMLARGPFVSSYKDPNAVFHYAGSCGYVVSGRSVGRVVQHLKHQEITDYDSALLSDASRSHPIQTYSMKEHLLRPSHDATSTIHTSRRLQASTMAPTMAPTMPPTTSKAPTEKVCKDWCKGHKEPWEKKCKEFKNCMGCAPCGEDGKVRKGECVGPAECSDKKEAECKRMRQQEGKCKWEYVKADVPPGECIGKKGQAECDDKDKNTCRQMKGKCKWLLSPAERKTPTGTCEGEAECIGKSRRVCHRFRLQEGKCKWKPAPENEVTVKTTIKGVDYNKCDAECKEELEAKITKTIAEQATDGDETAVAVETMAATRRLQQQNNKKGINVEAKIDLEEQIGIMEAENEGQEVDLISKMQAIKGEVEKGLETEDVKKEILKEATSVEGVKEAADGEITITDAETGTTAEAATVAPEVDSSYSEIELSDTTASPSSGDGTTMELDTTASPSSGDVDAAIHASALASLLIAIVVASQSL
jgi:GR25 family glycosyltransferase involved in LPS biosynthesis